jgi:endonuclease/exonuclease/phosphatase family metal-dependent hydrolase
MFFSALVEFTSAVYSFNVSRQHFWLIAFYLLVFFAPASLGIAPVKRFLQSYLALVFALLTLALAGAFLDERISRTWLLGVGFGGGFLAFAQTWTYLPKPSRERPQLALFTGLLCLLLLRYSFYSINPLWFSKPFAVVAAALTLTSCALVWHEQRHYAHLWSRPDSAPTHVPFVFYVYRNAFEDEAQLAELPSYWWCNGLGLGATLFLTHLFYTGHGTVSRWAGLDPFPSCLFVLVALMLGVLVATSPALHGLITWLTAVAGGALLAFGSGAPVVAGGCLLAFAVPPFWFHAVANLAASRAGRTLVVAVVFYLVLVYLSVAAVAFETLPLGVVLQNRLWLSILFALLGVACALGRDLLPSCPPWPRKEDWTLAPRFAVLLIFALVLFGIVPSTIRRSVGPVEQEGVPLSGLQPPIGALAHGLRELLEALRGDAKSKPVAPLQPVSGEEGAPGGVPWSRDRTKVVAVQLNIQQGYDERGFVNFEPLLAYLRSVNPDLVALEDTETNRIFSGNRDAVEFLTFNLGMYGYYGLPTREATWGAALLSKQPLTVSWARTLSSNGEMALLLGAELRVLNGTAQVPVSVFVARFSSAESDRIAQGSLVALAIEQVRPITQPVVLLGGFNSEPDSLALLPIQQRLIDAYATAHNMTHSPTFRSRTVDYVFFRQLDLSLCRVDADAAVSAHRPLVTEFYLMGDL